MDFGKQIREVCSPLIEFIVVLGVTRRPIHVLHRSGSERDEHRALHLVLCRVLLALRFWVAKALATILKLAAVEASRFVSDRIHRYVLQSPNTS